MPIARLTDPIGRVQLGRYTHAGGIYLVRLLTHGGRRLFTDLATGRQVAQALIRTERLGYGQTLGWSLLEDRLLWLCHLSEDGRSLARLVGSFKGTSTWLLCRGRPKLYGKVWTSGYEDEALEGREALLGVVRRLVAAPVEAGLVSRSGEHPHWDLRVLGRR